jgi:DNA-binding transcriptional regulator LsrR (DeoR family)
MNETDLQIIEMFYEDGMKESEIAESMGISELAVHEVLAAYEEGDEIVDTYHRWDCEGDVEEEGEKPCPGGKNASPH